MAVTPTRRRTGGARGPQQQQRWLAAAPAQRWGPYRELQELQDVTTQLLESFMGGGTSDAAPWVPMADIEETEDAWIITAELPGVSSDDINVEVNDNELAITGEIKERERKGILRRRTRRVGEFELRVTLPGQINAEAMDARLDDGILTVTVPKPEQARPRRVAVQSGGTEGRMSEGGDGGGAASGAGGAGASGATGAAGSGGAQAGQPGAS
jgi:HSP20 family protein